MQQKKYDFDKVIDRSGTNALKTDVLEKRYGRSDLIPLWVADMDFETPDFITDALKKRLEHSLFGYTLEPRTYWDTVIAWIRDSHGWEVERKWLTYIPGIVKGIGMVINVFSEPGDKVIIQPPVYHPFRLVPEGNGRKVVNNPLKLVDGRYEMDFDQLESVIDEKCKILILSNPHNPAGITWGPDTLRRLADICAAHGIPVISDEIHSDMALYGHRHTPFAMVSETAARNSITFAAPSKTFNIAGIVSSYAIVPDDTLRRRFYTWLEANELNQAPIFAPIATQAAYTEGKEWMRQMLAYVMANIDFVDEFIRAEIPQIKVMKPEASFLVWLDCRGLGLSHEALADLFVNRARLVLNDGEMFGPGGEGYMRLNVGIPRSILQTALNRLKSAVDNL